MHFLNLLNQLPCHCITAPPPLQADRLALCSYLVTGQLLGGEVGSVVMFAIPKAAGQRSMDESFLQVGGVAGTVCGGRQGRVGMVGGWYGWWFKYYLLGGCVCCAPEEAGLTEQ